MNGVPAWAVRGAKVVRILPYNSVGTVCNTEPGPALGDIVTIELAHWCNATKTDEAGYFLWLVEHPICEYAIELFAPLVDDEQDDHIEAAFFLGKGLRHKQPSKVDA